MVSVVAAAMFRASCCLRAPKLASWQFSRTDRTSEFSACRPADWCRQLRMHITHRVLSVLARPP
jgi:hypothetical protein